MWLMVKLSTKGKQSRQKILEQAADLIHQQGVKNTSIDDILAASGMGKSQFYHYFGNRDKFLKAVHDHYLETVAYHQISSIQGIRSWSDFSKWFQSMRTWQEKDIPGCPLGSMADEIANTNEHLRQDFALMFNQIQQTLARLFACMKAAGDLRGDINPDTLAEFTQANVQGALLMAKIKKDISVLDDVLSHTLQYLRSHATDPQRDPFKALL